MPTSDQVEAVGAKDLVTFTVVSDGQVVPGTVRFTGIAIYKAVGRIPFARIEIADGDPASQTFETSESTFFVPGAEIEIRAGYRSEEEPVFKGVVVSQQIRVNEAGPSQLVVMCRHALFKATLTRRSRSFVDASDDEVVTELLAEYGVTVDSGVSGLPAHEALVQFQVTDWDFVLARAESNGLFLVPTDAGATLAAPELSGEPALSLAYGSTILALEAQFDARTQPAEATALAWDHASQEPVTSSADEPSLPLRRKPRAGIPCRGPRATPAARPSGQYQPGRARWVRQCQPAGSALAPVHRSRAVRGNPSPAPRDNRGVAGTR